ncbi:hypothetical protein ABPG75_013697 [Micractinium tetrahymenae]
MFKRSKVMERWEGGKSRPVSQSGWEESVGVGACARARRGQRKKERAHAQVPGECARRLGAKASGKQLAEAGDKVRSAGDTRLVAAARERPARRGGGPLCSVSVPAHPSHSGGRKNGQRWAQEVLGHEWPAAGSAGGLSDADLPRFAPPSWGGEEEATHRHAAPILTLEA